MLNDQPENHTEMLLPRINYLTIFDDSALSPARMTQPKTLISFHLENRILETFFNR